MYESGNLIFNLFLIVFLLFSNGFFVAAEFSIVKVRKTRIEQLVKEGDSNAEVALEAIKDLDKFIAAVQLGVTISSIGLGWIGEATLAKIIEPCFMFLPHTSQMIAVHSVSATIAFILITFLHVVLGELIPKSIALEYTEKTALLIARPMNVMTVIFNPFIWLLNGFGNLVLKLLHIPRANQSSLVHSSEELDMLVDASYNGGVLNETEKDMLHNVFNFSDLTAREVMIPRTDMLCVSIDMSLEELNKFATENQYTRYPVYDGDIDHITGIIHVKDLYKLSVDDTENCPIARIQREVLLVPETITMDKLVLEFKKDKAQIAIVVDEFGGTSGLITLEDVIEEIIGDVQDEFDEEESDIKEISPNKYLVNASLRTDELAEFINIDEEIIEDEDVDTIGGLVVKLLGRIAEVGDTVSNNGLTYTVKEIDGARITKLEIIKEETSVQEQIQD